MTTPESRMTAINRAKREHGGPPIVALLHNDRTVSLTLAAKLQAAGLKVFHVGNADRLLKLLGAEPVDIVLLAKELEGLFTGIEIVRKLRISLIQIPVVIVGRKLAPLCDDAKRLGAVTLVEMADGREMICVREAVKTVNRILAYKSDDQPAISARARVLVERQADLPILSQLVLRLVSYLQMDAEDVPLQEVCRDISVDPKATAVLLRAANAASNGLRREAVTVQDAIRIVGLRPSIGRILNAAIADGIGVLAQGLPKGVRHWHAERSVIIASTSSTFAEKIEHQDGEPAFALGLLQDVGILLLFRAFPTDYAAVLQEWQAVGHLKLGEIERTALGYSHAEVSAALVERWQLPKSLIVSVLHHLLPSADAAALGVDIALHRVTQIGEAVADLVEAPQLSRRSALRRMLLDYGRTERSACARALRTAAARTAEASRLLSVPVPSTPELETFVRLALSLDRPPLGESVVAR
jgi:HD-like signal output (HDOD) protein